MIASASESDATADQRSDDIALLHYLRELDGITSPDQLFEETHRALKQVIPFDRIAIGLLTDRERVFRTRWQTGVDLGLPDGYETLPADSRSLTGRALETGTTALHTVPDHEDIFRGDPLRRSHGIRQVLIAPMYVDNQVFGVLKLYSTTRVPFTKAHGDFAEHVARIAGHMLARLDQRTTMAAREQVFSETRQLLRLLQTDRLETLKRRLMEELAARTDAAVLRYDLLPGGLSQTAHRHLPPAMAGDRTPEDIAALITRPVQAHVKQHLGPDRAAVLATNVEPGLPSGIPIISLDAIAEPFDVGAVLLASLRSPDGTPQSVFVVAWPDEVDADIACRESEGIIKALEAVEPTFRHLHQVEALQRQVAELDTIRRLIDAVARTPNMQNALEVVCRSAQLMTGLEFVAIAEVLSGHVVWKAASGARNTDFLHRRLPVPEHILNAMLDREPELIIDDIRLDPAFTPEIMPVHTSEQLRSTVIVPVHVNTRLRATLLGSQRHLHAFTPGQLSLVHSIAGAVATAFAANDARLADVAAVAQERTRTP